MPSQPRQLNPSPPHTPQMSVFILEFGTPSHPAHDVPAANRVTSVQTEYSFQPIQTRGHNILNTINISAILALQVNLRPQSDGAVACLPLPPQTPQASTRSPPKPRPLLILAAAGNHCRSGLGTPSQPVHDAFHRPPEAAGPPGKQTADDGIAPLVPQ